MKTRLLVSMLMLAFLIAAPNAEAQNRKERKLKKELRKLERQQEKVMKLQGNEHLFFEQEALERLEEELERKHEWIDQNEARIFDKSNHAWQKADELRSLKDYHVRDEVLKSQKQAQIKQREALEKARISQRKALEQARMAQRKAMEQARKQFEKQREEYRLHPEKFPEGFEFREFEIPDFDFDFELPEIELPNLDFQYAPYRGLVYADENDNSLVINKKLDGESMAKDYSYQVADKANQFEVSVSGSVDDGEVKIIIISPNGEEFQNIELSPAADVKWNHKVKIDGDEEQGFTGKWTVSISAEEAKGQCSVRMRSR